MPPFLAGPKGSCFVPFLLWLTRTEWCPLSQPNRDVTTKAKATWVTTTFPGLIFLTSREAAHYLNGLSRITSPDLNSGSVTGQQWQPAALSPRTISMLSESIPYSGEDSGLKKTGAAMVTP